MDVDKPRPATVPALTYVYPSSLASSGAAGQLALMPPESTPSPLAAGPQSVVVEQLVPVKKPASYPARSWSARAASEGVATLESHPSDNDIFVSTLGDQFRPTQELVNQIWAIQAMTEALSKAVPEYATYIDTSTLWVDGKADYWTIRNWTALVLLQHYSYIAYVPFPHLKPTDPAKYVSIALQIFADRAKQSNATVRFFDYWSGSDMRSILDAIRLEYAQGNLDRTKLLGFRNFVNDVMYISIEWMYIMYGYYLHYWIHSTIKKDLDSPITVQERRAFFAILQDNTAFMMIIGRHLRILETLGLGASDVHPYDFFPMQSTAFAMTKLAEQIHTSPYTEAVKEAVAAIPNTTQWFADVHNQATVVLNNLIIYGGRIGSSVDQKPSSKSVPKYKTALKFDEDDAKQSRPKPVAAKQKLRFEDSDD